MRACELNEAQFWPIGLIAQELGIDGDEIG
jgi:hypothetical protein